MSFHRREWAIQRAGWLLLSGFVLMAALGLFGHGPLSDAHASDGDGRTRIAYERFLRIWAPARLTIDRGLDTTIPKDGLRLHLSRPFFDGIRIERLTPDPIAIDVGPDEVSLQFGAPAEGATTFSVVLDFQPQKGGRQTAAFRWANGAEVRLTQFVYY